MNRPQALGSSCLSRLLICALLVLPVGAADAGASREPIQISGVRAELADTTQTYTKNATPYWRWRTDWLLHWERLARASHYELQFLTSEGMSGRSRRFIAPPFRLEVAKGDNLQAAEFAHPGDPTLNDPKSTCGSHHRAFRRRLEKLTQPVVVRRTHIKVS